MVPVAMVPHVRYLNICRLCCDVILVSFELIKRKGGTSDVLMDIIMWLFLFSVDEVFATHLVNWKAMALWKDCKMYIALQH